VPEQGFGDNIRCLRPPARKATQNPKTRKHATSEFYQNWRNAEGRLTGERTKGTASETFDNRDNTWIGESARKATSRQDRYLASTLNKNNEKRRMAAT